ncbi:truncated FRIGIDA-like protein 1 [Iris pallida]|uniref:FRIGIDA-like protein n=1 Tax=Iris pallida TaxID=29817 RepID=A0AAX6E7I4_IRIPA|nr:truncated FRIGIDA-like protein 1 [Iris pallida]
MATMKKIAEAIKSIPEKKESLRKALDSVRSAMPTFTLDWNGLEHHLSAIESSIVSRFKSLEAEGQKLASSTATATLPPSPPPQEAAAEVDATPRPELVSLCVGNDAKGLITFIADSFNGAWSDLDAVLAELGPALRAAPDPAQLVLEAVEGFPSSTSYKERKACANLLERLQSVSPEIGPSTRERALKLAAEWKGYIPDKRVATLEIIVFLQLIASYSLVSLFDHGEVLDLFCRVSGRRQAFGLVRNLGLVDRFSEVIQKLSSKGRQLDAVKLVYAYNFVDKFPPVPLLEAYVKQSKRMAQEIKKNGKNSKQAQSEAASQEMGALQSVLKTIEDCKLEKQYPRDGLEKRINQLEQQKANDKKRNTAVAAVSNSKNQRQPKKRSCPQPPATTSAHPITADSYPPSHQTHLQHGLSDHAYPQHDPTNHVYPQHGLTDHASHMAGPYALASSGSVYNHAATSLPSSALGHGGTRSPCRPYLYPPESFAGTGGLYDRPATYSGYPPPSRLPPSYGSSLYP